MSLLGTTVWELRASATANNLNGGGFNPSNAAPGTDYSQQDAAQKANTDLAVVDATDRVASVFAPFTSDDNGNIIHITAGTNFTPGWYEIVSVDGDGIATLDRACGTLSGIGGTFYVGGAISLNSSVAAYGDDDFFETGIAGMIYYMKFGSFTVGETVAVAAAGGTENPIKIIGYNSTRGDTPTGANRPTLGMATNTFSLGVNWDVYNLISIASNATVALTINTNGKVVNCKIVNSSVTGNRTALAPGSDTFIFNNEIICYRGYGISQGSSIGTEIVGNWVHDCVIGIRDGATGGRWYVVGNIVESCVTAAISWAAASTASTLVYGNTLYGSENTTGIGVNLATGNTDRRLLNNIIYGFSTGVAHADTQSVGFDDYNDYFNNDADVSAAGQWQKGANDQAIDPAFTSVGQVTGTTATYAGSTLTDAGKFANVVAGRDYIYIISGTGMTAGIYGISSKTDNTVVTDIDAGENVAGDIVYQITIGRNFLPTGDI